MTSKSHLVTLGATDWALWRWAAVRAAGFPAHDTLQLAHHRSARAADRLLAEEDRLEQVWLEVTAQVDARTARFHEPMRDDVYEQQERSATQLLRRVRKLAARREFGEELVAALPRRLQESLREHHGEWARYQSEYDHELCDARTSASETLGRFARHPGYREAITWQNPSVLSNAIDPLANPESRRESGKRRRQREALLANYIQRYCTKNDTIGFFGPMGWGQFNLGTQDAKLVPGPELLAERNVYFEDWAISALSEKLSRDPAYRPWLIPRIAPFLRWDGT